MNRFGRGLIVGKFYPPHEGHHRLIDCGLAACDHLIVCVLAATHESIPMDARAAWLRERHPSADVRAAVDDHPIDYDDPAVYDLHDEVISSIVPETIDVVISAERYGAIMAARYGCTHLTIERDQLSATAVRDDPIAHWNNLQPGVRAHLTKRVAIVGAESTGTTTLCEALAEHYNTEYVAEHGRQVSAERFAAGTFGRWTHEDFHLIASAQQGAEDQAALRAGPLLICDTEALATCIWEERYLGHSTPETEALADARSYALYILTLDDVPFVQDGLRDGEHLRAWMTARFRERLAERTEPVVEVSGSREERLATAIRAIASIRRWDFAEPLAERHSHTPASDPTAKRRPRQK